MSPAPHAYLDQKYDETTELGLTWAGAVEVRDAYEWDPARVIEGAEVLGVEAAAVDRDDRDPGRHRLARSSRACPRPPRSAGRDRATGRTSASGWPPRRLLSELGVDFHRSKQVAWS